MLTATPTAVFRYRPPASALARGGSDLLVGMATTDIAEVRDPDESLMGRMAGGDEGAFAAFYDRHAPLLLGIAWKILQNEAEAEDALQEAMVQLWERSGDYNPALGKPLSWAVALTRNKSIDRRRALQRKSALHEEAGAEPESASEIPAPRNASPGLDELQLVQKALRYLPAEQREAVELAFLRGMTHLEISDRVAAPLGTIKARIRRGLLAMRDALEGQL